MAKLKDNDRRAVWAEFMRDLGRRPDKKHPARMEQCALRKPELLKAVSGIDDYLDQFASQPTKVTAAAMRGSRVSRRAIQRLTDEQVDRLAGWLLQKRQPPKSPAPAKKTPSKKR